MGRGTEFTGDLPKKLSVFFASLVALFVFGTVGYIVLMKVPVADAFFMTLETLVFIFHGETEFLKFFEMFLALFGGFLFWWALWSMFDIILGGTLVEYLDEINFQKRLKSMKNHYIIAGGGRVGQEICHRLKAKKMQCIIVENDGKKVSKVRKDGLEVIHGDATNIQTLQKANIENAKAIVLTLPETQTNLLIIMLAKELKPKIEIYARADNVEYVNALKDAGAKFVVVPELAAVEKLVKEIT